MLKPEHHEAGCPPWPFYIKRSFMFDSGTCLDLEFSRRHNFTLLDSSPYRHRDYMKSNQIAEFFQVSPVYLPQIYEDESKDWVFFYLDTKPFDMIVVLDSKEVSETNKRALLTSMDEWTWALTLVSLTTISLSLHYLRIIPKESGGLVGILISIFGTLISQGMNLPKIKFSLFLTFGTWSLVTIVITNGYAGFLLAQLTKPSVPSVPKDMAGLLNSSFHFDMFSFTITFVTNSSFPDFRGHELEFERAVKRYRDAEVLRGKECPICEWILKKIRFTNSILLQLYGKSESIFHNILGSLMAIKKYDLIRTHSNQRRFRKNFVLIDKERCFGALIHALRLLFKNEKLVVQRGLTPPFSNTHASFTMKSDASRLAQKHFSRVHSSGLFSQWNRAFEIFQSNEIGWTYDITFNLTREDRYSKLLLPNVYQRPDPQKLTIDHLAVHLFILGSSLALCTFIFMIEYLTHLLNAYFLLTLTLAGARAI